MLWAWNVDIFVRLDLRGWAPPATHYHFNHWTTLCVPAGYRVCEPGQIRCRSGQCVGEAQFCAGLVTCADSSVYIDDSVCRQYRRLRHAALY